MSQPSEADEPTMDEILSSIRRIIAEENPSDEGEQLQDVTDPYPDVPHNVITEKAEFEDSLTDDFAADRPVSDPKPAESGFQSDSNSPDIEDALELDTIATDFGDDSLASATDAFDASLPDLDGPDATIQEKIIDSSLADDTGDTSETSGDSGSMADNDDPFAEIVSDESLTNALKSAGFDFTDSLEDDESEETSGRRAMDSSSHEASEKADSMSDDLDSLLEELGQENRQKTETFDASDMAAMNRKTEETFEPSLEASGPAAGDTKPEDIPAPDVSSNVPPQTIAAGPAILKSAASSTSDANHKQLHGNQPSKRIVGSVSRKKPIAEGRIAPTAKKDKTMASQVQSGSILADRTEGAARSSISRLQDTISPDRHATPLPSGTMEAFVAEMMRPMLRDWMDQNLPNIVEQIVEKEIAKMVKRAELD